MFPLKREPVAHRVGFAVAYCVIGYQDKGVLNRFVLNREDIRLKPVQFLNANVHYDTRKHLELWPTSAANILGSFGYTEKNLYDLIIHGEEQKAL